MSQPANIIFDLDGTLIDSSEGVVEAVNYSLLKMGEPPQQPEIIKSFIGFPLSTMYPHFTKVPLKELYRHFQVKASETVVSSTVVLPGVTETIDQLINQGFNLAIASTKIRPHIEGIIKKFDWENIFKTYSGGNEVEKDKPDPSIFIMTLDRMHAEAGETIVVGDTINDVLAAKAVPMRVVAVKSPYSENDDLKNAKPDYYLDVISRLPELLRGIK